MHILMISDVYFPRINGVSTSIRTFKQELGLLGHEVSLIAPEYGQGEQEEDWIYRVPSSYLPMDPEDRVMKKRAVISIYEKYLQHRHFDLIHIQTPFVAYYAGMKLAHKLGLNDHILFVGYLDRASKLLNCYCAGDIFVFASKTETQGLVLLEAMAQGIPVVSLAAMGTSDILASGMGAVIADDNHEDFAQKVVDVLNNPGQRQRLGHDAHSYARTWSARKHAMHKAHFYSQIVENHAVGAMS